MQSSLLRLPCFGAFFLLCSSLFAQPFAGNFIPHGPGGGGYTYSPSISPHDPNHIFLVCDMGGVYRSENGAQTWQLVPSSSLVSTVKGKVHFTSDPEVLYVCRRSLTNLNDPLFRGELAKSTNGGLDWQALNDPTESGVHRLEVDPNSTQRMLLNEYNRLFFSDNGGETWSMVFQPADDQMWLGGVFWDGADILVGTNKGLLVSHDGGQTFALEAHAGIPGGTGIMHLAGAKSGGTVRLFAIGAAATELYAWNEPLGLRDHLIGFYRMDYSLGASWTNTKGNIPFGIRIAGVDLAENNTQTVWAAGDEDGLPMVFKSINGGVTWVNTFQAIDNQNVSTGWGGDYGAFSYLWSGAALGFEVSSVDPDQVILSDGMGHITNDGGASWSATYVQPGDQNPAGSPTAVDKFYRSSGLDVTTTHQLFWLNDQEMFSANTDIGLSFSADAGQSWSFARNTFYPWGTVANPNWYRMVQRPDNQHLFAAVAEVNDIYLGYRIADHQISGGGLVLKSTDQGTTWDTLFNFGRPVVWLELDKNNPNRMFASVVHPQSGGIYRTNNSGVTWTKLNLPARTEGHPYNIISLNDGGLVVTFSARALPDGETLTESSGVFYSPDGGSTWLDRTDAAMKWYSKDLVVDPQDTTQNTWYTTVWGRFTVFQGPNNAGNGGLYKTTNRGETWTRILANESAESLSIHPSKPGHAYLSVENDGLYFTSNLASAQPVFERVTGFPFWRPKRVFFKPNNPAEVWVSTMGGGLWQGTASPDGTVNYAPSTEDFANPERGFMQFTETNSSNYTPVSAANLAAWRTLNQPFGADYSIYSTLGYRGFYLESFKNGPISNAYLNAMQADFDAARQAGVKFVVRFAYTKKDTPPFGDAPKNIVLQHIAQLKPLLQANADVIAVLQMGFIGAWGEGYYTDHFGFGSLSAQNWTDRTEVLNALLDAMPPERSVQVRVPQMKQKAVYGPAAPPNSPALTVEEAWQNTAKARIGFVNDCFLSSADDVGTYINYDLNPSGCDTCVFKPYVAEDSKYVPVGGETCINWDPYSDCDEQPGGGAQTEMARMHFSYLNSGWNNELNNEWVSGGCIEEIKQRLGYRLELQSGEFPTEAGPGQTISVKIDLQNKGFAAPFNARNLRLLMRNVATAAIWHVDLPDDPRRWLPGNQIHSIEHTFCLPFEMPAGNYELLLHLPDPQPLLANRPEYALRLANQNTWEAATGYNRLLHQISVNPTAPNPNCSGETCFQPAVLPIPNANFSALASSGCAPFVVTFSNQSASCWNYDWSFPGGTPSSSNEANPVIIYQDAGLYDVGLNVTNAAGTGAETKTDYISIAPLPGAAFIFLVNGLSASFSNSSINANAYSWDFGDGSPVSTEQSPVHVFPAPGNYTVILTASNACGQNNFQQLVSVQCPVVSVVLSTSGNLALCPGDSASIFASSGFAQYVWQRDGSVISGANLDQLVVYAPGMYQVLVTDSMGCLGTSNTIEVTVNPQPAPAFTATENGLSVSFLNTSMDASDYFWDFGDGSPGSSALNPVHSYAAPGVYQVTLYASNAACGTFSYSAMVTAVCVAPQVQISSSGATQFCAGDSVVLTVSGGTFATYNWYWNDQELAGQNAPSLVASEPGVYKVLVVDATACSNFSNELVLEVLPMPAISIEGPSGGVCAGSALLLNATGGVNYVWNLPSGNIQVGPLLLISNVTAANAGEYHLSVSDTNGCAATAVYPVQVYALPITQIQPTGPISLTYGDSVLLDGGAGFSAWQWSTGEITQQIYVSDCGEYGLSVLDSNACMGFSAPVTIWVRPVLSYANGMLSSSPASSYQWLLDGVLIPGATEQNLIPNTSGEYTVLVNCAGTELLSDPYLVQIVGVSEAHTWRMKLYPNPVSASKNWLTVDMQGLDNKPVTLILTDLSGRLMLQKTEPEFSGKAMLDTGEIPAGTYWVQAWQSGSMLATGMFLKL